MLKIDRKAVMRHYQPRNASNYREANTGDHRDGRKCAQGKHDDFVFRTLVHIKLHSFEQNA